MSDLQATSLYQIAPKTLRIQARYASQMCMSSKTNPPTNCLHQPPVCSDQDRSERTLFVLTHFDALSIESSLFLSQATTCRMTRVCVKQLDNRKVPPEFDRIRAQTSHRNAKYCFPRPVCSLCSTIFARSALGPKSFLSTVRRPQNLLQSNSRIQSDRNGSELKKRFSNALWPSL